MTLLFGYFILVISCLICVAFFTLLERKILGISGFRLGPLKVSLGGFFQPIGDAGKLMNKESNILSNFSFLFYYGSSMFMLLSSLMLFSLLEEDSFLSNFKFSFLVFLVILSFNSLNFIFCGWSIYSKFSLLGSLRTVSQLISYEGPLYICLFFIFGLYFSFDFQVVKSTDFMIFPSLPLVFMFWLICVFSELNRAPYDFSEGESELVSGFNVEFGSSSFTLIFLSEYGFIFFFMVFTSFLFFSSSSLFWLLFFFFIVWVRSVVPRYRFDKLMNLSWKVLIPQLGLILLFFIFMVS